MHAYLGEDSGVEGQWDPIPGSGKYLCGVRYRTGENGVDLLARRCSTDGGIPVCRCRAS